ncbi:hypothetical protein PSACC_00789 [Paramicrosporidium saccamoebae]|uniref:Peroxisomal membrane protein PEX16 n=1 Tax=Paramicrosporidium saccamoebae TaxID=1246581 RepID=A0A2H9TNY2_9FUNG|nr:hypothetical protein PSACC_00789 [Paramicrosporidium saccamoebae]
MGAHDAYQRFMSDNAARIAAVENVLRSISYVIPVYSSLNLLRLVNESAIVRSGKVSGEGVARGAWNAYVLYLRRKSKLLDTLLTLLNIAWTVEVPLEMLVSRLLGLSSRIRYVVILEVIKAASRLYLFVKSGWRPVLRNHLPDVMAGEYRGKQDSYDELVSDIKCSGEGKENEGVWTFLRKHRMDAYTLVPELSVSPVGDWLGRAREMTHILRPLIYTILLTAGREKTRWSAWSISLAMDLFSEWPQLKTLVMGKQVETKDSPIEKNEKQIRMIKLLLYLLREPLYSTASKKYIDSVAGTLSHWRLLRPFVETAKSYQKLCEKVSYYTLGS